MGVTYSGYHSGIVLTNDNQSKNPVTIAANGTIAGTSAYSGDAVYAANYPWQITNFGTIAPSTTGGVGIEFAYPGVLYNFGSIAGGVDGVRLMTNTSSGVISGGILGAPYGSTGFHNFVENLGTVLGGISGAGVVNGGSTATDALISGGVVGEVSINQGTSFYGSDVTNFGTILGTDAVRKMGVLANHGLIEGTGPGGIGAIIYADTGPLPNQMVNLGTIMATGSDGVGAEITMVTKGPNLFVDNGAAGSNAALIEGGRTGLYLATGPGEIVTNFGTIAATTAGGVGVSFAGSGMLINEPGASIAGGIVMTGGGTVTDAGAIAGGISLGGTGSNLLVLQPGYTLGGTVAAAGSSNTVQLDGSAGAPVTVDFNALAGFDIAAFQPEAANYATLVIDDTAALPGTITGFAGAHEAIDLTTLSDAGNDAMVTFDRSSDMLTVSGDNGSVALRLDDEFYPGFIVENDGSGGSLVTLAPANAVFSGTYTSGVLLSNAMTQSPATVTASGSIANRGTTNQGAAVYAVQQTAWTLTNYGRIANRAGGGDGVRLPDGGEVVNDGVIKGGKTADGVYIAGSSAASGAMPVQATVANLGTIAGGKTGVALVTTDASPFGGVGIYGTVINGVSGTNLGLIEGGTFSVTGATVVTNYGTLAGGVAAGGVTNAGTILGNVFAAGVVNLAGGVIDGDVAASFESGISHPIVIAGPVDNSGTIVGNVTGFVTNYGWIYGTVLEQGTRVANYGTIDATGKGSVGVTFASEGSVGPIQNGGSAATAALIEGDAFGIDTMTLDTPITNYGTIAATGKSGIGIKIPGSNATLVNFGLVTGSTGVGFDNAGDTIVNAGTIAGTGGTAISLGTGGLLAVDPGAVFVGYVVGSGSDTLELAPGSGTLAGLGSQFQYFATLLVDPGASWSLSGSAPGVVNDGTVSVYGALGFGQVTHDTGERGIIDLGGSGTAEFTATVAKGETLQFTDNSSTLLLDEPRRFKATIAGFVAGDAIDLAGVTANGLTFADHHLAVTEHGRTVADLHLAGHYKTGDFSLSPDGNGGTEITLLAPAAASLWTLRG